MATSSRAWARRGHLPIRTAAQGARQTCRRRTGAPRVHLTRASRAAAGVRPGPLRHMSTMKAPPVTATATGMGTATVTVMATATATGTFSRSTVRRHSRCARARPPALRRSTTSPVHTNTSCLSTTMSQIQLLQIPMAILLLVSARRRQRRSRSRKRRRQPPLERLLRITRATTRCFTRTAPRTMRNTSTMATTSEVPRHCARLITASVDGQPMAHLMVAAQDTPPPTTLPSRGRA